MMNRYMPLYEDISKIPVNIDEYGIFDKPVTITIKYKAIVDIGSKIYIQDYKVMKDLGNGLLEVKTKEFHKTYMYPFGVAQNITRAATRGTWEEPKKTVKRQVWKEKIMDDVQYGKVRRLLPGDLQEGEIKLKVEGISWNPGTPLVFESNFEIVGHHKAPEA